MNIIKIVVALCNNDVISCYIVHYIPLLQLRGFHINIYTATAGICKSAIYGVPTIACQLTLKLFMSILHFMLLSDFYFIYN